jgi:eukaryotic-like serine/threonine-protein kinase
MGRTDYAELPLGCPRMLSVSDTLSPIATGLFAKLQDRVSTKYEVGERLGRGGMGDVYRAYDPALRRVVAIKYLRSQDPALVERFLREARLQARVEHELVCRVYDAGNDDGVPYICMEYVEGRTLDEAAADMTRADKVAVVRDVALAVHAAHETGLIHRDIKPQNVLVERGTAGWRPHVMDFGLARDPASPGDTKTGDLLGTPWYMSPEQAQGDVRRLDRRTDVYSLGALLYRLLVGRTPFEGTALEVLVKVVRAEAVPPRRLDPALPIDLDTIVVRCLEKDPARRYPSALALARDLERHARGEAIVARALTPLDRLRRSARRNRAPVAVIAVASLLSLAALGTAWKARRDGEARAAAAQRFGAEAARLQDLLRSAELLPAHDTRVERAGIRADMKRLEAEMARMGAVALGPGHYALGQGFLALGDDARARTELERAWSLGYRTPAVAFALGQALGGLYRRALEDAQGFGSPALRDAHRREAEIALRDPALGYLRTGGSDAAQPRAYIDGLVAFHERRYADAVQGARAALQQAPWLYEARLLEGDVYFAQGLQARDRGAYDVALANNECAGAVYRELTETARSFRRGYQQQCLRLVKEQEIRMRLGRETQETFIAADAACRLSLGIDPDDGETYSRLAQLYWRRGEILRDRGSDNREVVKQAAALGEEATRRVPEL